MKKILVSVFFALLFFISFAGAPLAVQAHADEHLLFRGNWQAVEHPVQVNLPWLTVDGNAAGRATVLGPYKATYTATVYNYPNGVGTATVSAKFTARDGSTFTASGNGLGIPTGTPNINHIVENYHITGGTGRFAHASGDFTVDRTLNLATGVNSGSVYGTIDLP